MEKTIMEKEIFKNQKEIGSKFGYTLYEVANGGMGALVFENKIFLSFEKPSCIEEAFTQVWLHKDEVVYVGKGGAYYIRIGERVQELIKHLGKNFILGAIGDPYLWDIYPTVDNGVDYYEVRYNEDDDVKPDAIGSYVFIKDEEEK